MSGVRGRALGVKLAVLVSACALGAPASWLEAAIVKIQDRKFPTGKFCPLESRAEAGADLSFVAPAATVRIRFSAANLDGGGAWNALRIDNVALVAKAVFDAHQTGPVPGFEDCYDPMPPPGQTTGGLPEAPAYDFNAAGTVEIVLDRFDSSAAEWSGPHIAFAAGVTAPSDPASGEGFSGGSLLLGEESDGQVTVSAARLAGGLTPGAPYVLTAWWSALGNNPLTLSIEVPCADQDADGQVLCTACDLAPGEACGDCDDLNPRCGVSCADADGDGWCPPADCSDAAATCTADCITDADLDATPDCRDGCLDADGDGYGSPGGGGNDCLGADCDGGNPWCNVSCTDADGDGHCLPGDCQDGNPAVADGLAEVNDCIDQGCPGDQGYGVIDELGPAAGFSGPGTSTFSWPAQPGALGYLAVRSGSPHFPPGCVVQTTATASWTDAALPPPGEIFHYLARAQSECKGSYGQGSSGEERAALCGMETACGNMLDDDGDGPADCADADCAGTAGCRAAEFVFDDSPDDDIQPADLYDFLQATPAGGGDYIFFEIAQNPSRAVAWCSVNAGFYRTSYLDLAPTFGSNVSGSWNRWVRSPSTGGAWQGPLTAPLANTFGDDCFGPYSWCSEQFSPEPQNAIFPDRVNDCEAYDLATGACGSTTGETWRLTIRVASSRQAACGF
ncbi:MAG TPA: hypothetical protein VJV23_13235 [Candidatus Polarisedimenticolia bacterium]|nr:hypothetical protein [Candidatus Polarisedimenticolia bacterium]